MKRVLEEREKHAFLPPFGNRGVNEERVDDFSETALNSVTKAAATMFCRIKLSSNRCVFKFGPVIRDYPRLTKTIVEDGDQMPEKINGSEVSVVRQPGSNYALRIIQIGNRSFTVKGKSGLRYKKRQNVGDLARFGRPRKSIANFVWSTHSPAWR